MIFEESSFSEEKEAKRLLAVCWGAAGRAAVRVGVCVMVGAAGPRVPEGAAPEVDRPYAVVDAHAQVALALAEAKRSRRIVLLEFGANWCADCRILAGVFAMPAVRDWMAAHFLLVQVNVGRFDRNMDLVARYGARMRAAPFLIALSPDGVRLDVDPLVFADAERLGPQGIVDKLDLVLAAAPLPN